MTRVSCSPTYLSCVTGVDATDIPKIDTCDWFRGLLKYHKLPLVHQVTRQGADKPMKACDWIRRLGFEGSIVPLLDQVQLYGYKAMVRLLNFDLFTSGSYDSQSQLEAIKKKAYLDIKDFHSKEYRATYRETEEDVIEDKLPGILKHKFGVNITTPEEREAQEEAEALEAAKKAGLIPENDTEEVVLPQVHRPKPEERPEFAKTAAGEEEVEALLQKQREKERSQGKAVPAAETAPPVLQISTSVTGCHDT